MKKFLIIISSLVVCFLFFNYAYYHLGKYFILFEKENAESFVKTEEGKILLDQGNGFEEFKIKGVNIGGARPGKWIPDFAIKKSDYLRWFRLISDMGANTIRIYTIHSPRFYEAIDEFNENNPNPLWVIQGVWLDDYMMDSHMDGWDKKIIELFEDNCINAIDVIHGKRKLEPGKGVATGTGTYRHDISKWVIGYIIGMEWSERTVAYTDDIHENDSSFCSYNGNYLYTDEDASAFEAMLTMVGDKMITYETNRYGTQRLLAFTNWPSTDPFVYPKNIKDKFGKCSKVDCENIKQTDRFVSGQFASYHVYPYFPDFLRYVSNWEQFFDGKREDFLLENGEINTYKAYLTMLNQHHEMPVVIAEFGVSTGRGLAHIDSSLGRNQGFVEEKAHGKALKECYDDIESSGANGGIVFSWQDEWVKKTWNTLYAVNLSRTPYWSNYQTNEQFFGLLSFDPGEKEPCCIVDGDKSEWNKKDIVFKDKEKALSIKYDEKFLYFLAEGENLLEKENVYIPLDVTPKTGSYYCENYGLHFNKPVDFVVKISQKGESRIVCEERYDSLRAAYSRSVLGFDTYLPKNIPDVDSPKFFPIYYVLNFRIFDNDFESSQDFEEPELFDDKNSLQRNAQRSICSCMRPRAPLRCRMPSRMPLRMLPPAVDTKKGRM